MRKAWHRIAWVAVLAVLGMLAAWQWRQDRAAAPGTLLQRAPATITHVRIERPGQPPQRYERRDGHWWRLGATPARADDGRLEAITALARTPVRRWRPDAGFDLRKLGLRPPQIRLYLDGQRVDYGALSPFGPLRYVHVGHRIGWIAAADSPPGARVSGPGSMP